MNIELSGETLKLARNDKEPQMLWYIRQYGLQGLMDIVTYISEHGATVKILAPFRMGSVSSQKMHKKCYDFVTSILTLLTPCDRMI